jgi:serine/threonine protein kinase
MADGGRNLTQFVQNVSEQQHDSDVAKNRIYHFWYHIRNLLRGLQHMQTNQLVHMDLKPGNIVYNETTSKIAMIDLGLTTNFKKLRDDFANNKFTLTTFHWNFAPELYFCNKSVFDSIQRMTPDILNGCIQRFDAAVTTNARRTRTELRQIDQSSNLYKIFNESIYFLIQVDQLDPSYSTTFLNSFKKMILRIHTEPNYDAFIERVLPRIDVYGMGVSLLHVLSHTSQIASDTVPEQKFRQKLSSLLFQMIDPNVYDRIDIDHALLSYEYLLQRDIAFNGWLRENTLIEAEAPAKSFAKSPAKSLAKSFAMSPAKSTPPPMFKPLSPLVPDAPSRTRRSRTKQFSGGRRRRSSRNRSHRRSRRR